MRASRVTWTQPCARRATLKSQRRIVVDLADLLGAQGRRAEAEEEYRRAIELKPALYEAHLALGMLLLKTGGEAKARVHLRKAAESSDPEVRQAALRALR